MFWVACSYPILVGQHAHIPSLLVKSHQITRKSHQSSCLTPIKSLACLAQIPWEITIFLVTSHRISLNPIEISMFHHFSRLVAFSHGFPIVFQWFSWWNPPRPTVGRATWIVSGARAGARAVLGHGSLAKQRGFNQQKAGDFYGIYLWFLVRKSMGIGISLWKQWDFIGIKWEIRIGRVKKNFISKESGLMTI